MSRKVEHYIREWRVDANMTQAEFARAVGMSPSNYNQLETGITGYTQSSLKKISEYLGVSPAALISINPLAEKNEGDEAEYSLKDEVIGILIAMNPATRSLALGLLKETLRHQNSLETMNKPGINLARLSMYSRFRI